MKNHLTPHRRAAAWLFAAAALPFTPLAAQDVPVVNAPPPVIVAPPPPVTTAPAPAPVVVRPAVTVPEPAPVATRAAPPPARTVTRTARAAPRAATRPRVEAAAPARRPAPAPAPVAAAPAPVPVAAAPEPLPVTTPPPAAPAEPAVAPQRNLTTLWPWLAGAAALLIAAIAFLALRRRRTEEEVYYEEPVHEAAPAVEAAPEPSFVRPEPIVAAAALHEREPEREPIADEIAIVESDAADVEALAAGSEPIAGRPWLEFLMRPLRAGTSRDDAIVQFELTVGNTGSVEAKDVRISTWMVAGGQGTDMERSLIDPPADATVNEVDIAAGDGARVEARIALPKSGMTEPVMPVVVADARYTLPDGSEGRTHASFEIGRRDGEGETLAPFPIDRSSGLSENVEARLHGEPERV